ncbi:MAG: 2OG-Fe(II) oxygenase [Pseudohongiellaceae bacterium]
MSGKKLKGDWLNWLQENLDRNCNPEELLDTLLKNDFDIQSIQRHMGQLFPKDSALLKQAGITAEMLTASSDINYVAIANTRITWNDSGIHAQRVLTDKLQLYTVDDFMGAEECERVIEISSTKLRPSTVTTGADYASYRTSSTCDLSLLNDAYVKTIDEKIARALGIQQSFSEGIQAQRYEVGQEFKEHTDYFKKDVYQKFAAAQGQRTWTFMVYLNEGMQGGGTRFHDLNRAFSPRRGMAVVWNNLNPDGTANPLTLHSGEPVTSGHKIVITKWFRERGRGPMFY